MLARALSGGARLCRLGPVGAPPASVGRAPAAGAAAGVALLPPAPSATCSSRRWGHGIKAPGVPWTVYHPHINDPERKMRITGQLEGKARYIPKNFRHQQYVESIRTGEYLGPDWPYNFLPKTFWSQRRYNVTYNPYPADMSPATGVLFVPRLNIWTVEWHELEKQRIRWFRCQYGFMKGKLHAESFRRALVQAGRVDNRRTDRQVQVQKLARQESLKLWKRKFSKKDARRLGNSGSRLGRESRVRRDYKARGLLP